MRSLKASFLGIVAILGFFGRGGHATEPLPPNPPQIAQSRRDFIASYAYRSGQSPGQSSQSLERLLNHDPQSYTVNNQPVLASDLVASLLATYPTDVLIDYLSHPPFSVDAAAFDRGLLDLERRKVEPAKLTTLARRYLLIGKSYDGKPRSDDQTRNLIEMARHYLASCESAEEINFFERFFCVESSTEKEMDLSKIQSQFLTESCLAHFPPHFACPPDRLPEETFGTALAPANQLANEIFQCHSDEDCVAMKTGCGLAKVVGRKKWEDSKIRCVCRREANLSGCFPARNIRN